MRITHYQSITGLLLGLILLSSCANYKLHYAKGIEPIQTPPAEKITHTIYLIGDAGNAEPPDGVPPAVALLGEKLRTASKNTSVVFLGDNIYPNGMAPKSAASERAMDEYRLKAQLDVVKDFPGRVFFVAGNHDWYGHGLDGLKRERKFIEDYLGRDDVFLPKPGCGDPIEIKLEDNLVLILLDSEWWLEDWQGETEINDGCDVKSRKLFKLFFEEAIKSNRNKNIVIAMHHPPYTYGSHGGQFTFRDHLFPLTALNKNLWIPLPVIGSIYPLFRSTFGTKQDLPHPDYKEFKDALISSARKNGSFIFVSGHEHALEYIEQDNQAYIVSGAGSKHSATSLGAGAQFTYGTNGISRLDFYEDGSAWVKFWTAEKPGGRLVFQKQIKDPLPLANADTLQHFPEYESGKTEVETPISHYDFQHGALWRFLWGEHYRKTYATKIEAPVLDLSTDAGGLTPTKLGGGYQTNSLRLEDKDGRQYAIRSIDKDASRTVPAPFNQSFVIDIVRDNFSASHPMAALAAAKLADAAGIFHTDPQVFYVPKQPKLGSFNDLFGGALYQLEKRPSGDWRTAANFGNTHDTESTLDLIEKMHEDRDVVIDEPSMIRARLFDMVIGDWDRHDDQWRWAEFDEGDKKVYRPIPRDRDQAFSKYDGVMVAFVRQFTGLSKQFRPYNDRIKNIKWSNYNARNVDPTFLSGLEWKDWEKEAHFLQEKLTDAVVDSAFRQTFPAPIYNLDAPGIIHKLKSRRDDLLDIARRYYEFVSRHVDVVGTTKKDLFEVERINDDSTRVRVYDTNKEGDRQEKLYDRTFLTSETKEIRLYGLDDDDIFNISGNVNKGIRIRAIGGLDKDIFNDQSHVRSGGRRTIIYDAKGEKNILNIDSETRTRITDDPILNTYNRRSEDYEYDYSIMLPMFALNPDDGVLIGGSLQRITYGFKKSPYSTKNIFSLKYAAETSGINFDYAGEYINVLGKWDLQLRTGFNTPLYAINFYGFGNDTRDQENTLDDEFYRVRQRNIYFEPALLRRINSAFSWSIGPTFESTRIERTKGRLIDDIGDNFDPELFDGLEFVGVRLRMDLKNVDNPAFPTHGIGWRLNTGWKLELDNTNKNFPFLRAALSLYQPLVKSGRLVFATRVGLSHNFNDKFEFYQGATLGSGTLEDADFRGVRRERFTGQTAFYNNIDLRLKLLDSQNQVLPFSMGIYGGFDYGRVWFPHEESNAWHYAYGGGIFFAPFDIVTIQAGLFTSDDKLLRFTLGSGFFF